MKNVLFLFFALCLVLSSCTSDLGEKEDDTSYFKFTPDDELKLVKPDIIGSSLKYKNQNGVVREFIIDKCEIDKDAETSGGGMGFFVGPATINYYFDTQETLASYFDENGGISLRIFFQNRPQVSKYLNHKYVYSSPRFLGSINFSIYNKNCNGSYNSSCGYDAFSQSSQLPSMIIDGKEYKNVLVFNSYNTTAYPTIGDYSNDSKTVNKIFYSYDYCMIGYDEVDGTQWRITD